MRIRRGGLERAGVGSYGLCRPLGSSVVSRWMRRAGARLTSGCWGDGVGVLDSVCLGGNCNLPRTGDIVVENNCHQHPGQRQWVAARRGEGRKPS